LSGVALLRGRLVVLVAAIAAVLAAGTWFALTRASAQSGSHHTATGQHSSSTGGGSQPATVSHGPLQVVSVTPATHTKHVNGGAPVKVQFSTALASDSPMPKLTPKVPGQWQQAGTSTLEFVAAKGFAPHTKVKVKIPGGANGMVSAGGSHLAQTVSAKFRTGSYSLLRLDQLLAQLKYLPLTWASSGTDASATDTAAQVAAAYQPPAGTFTWEHGYPKRLRTFWKPGHTSLVQTGAIMAFESEHGMTMDGQAGPQMWAKLLKAVARGQNNSRGYTYALASEKSPETLTVWHNGHVVMHTLANTGAPNAPTTIGTAAVYLRYTFQIMKGTNPDGTKYADPVSWVSYFRAGEAVHYFGRASYGSEQSLGCVELPLKQAKAVWPYMTYGTLVTVAAP
jgi:hypothetical protein